MRTSRNFIIICATISFASMFFGACAGVSWLALRITSKPQVFRSLAKVVIGSRMRTQSDAQGQEQGFYGAIIETLESPELNRKAQERVHALHPELTVSGVDIRVVQTKGSAIFNILATGSEPKYTQIFLNALLDEFMSFCQRMHGSWREEFLNVHIQERATTASEHVDDWKMPIIQAGASGAVLGLVAGLLTSLFISLLGQSNAPHA